MKKDKIKLQKRSAARISFRIFQDPSTLFSFLIRGIVRYIIITRMVVEKRRKSVNAAASSLYSAWPVSIDRRTFCFTPFALIRPSRREASTLPQPLRQPRSPFTLFLSEIRRAALSPLPLPFQPFDPQPTTLSSFFLEEATSSTVSPPPSMPFGRKERKIKKEERGKKGKKGEGMSWLGRGELVVSGAVVFTFSLSLSLSRVLIAYRLDLNGASSRIFTIFSKNLYIYKFI